MELINSSIEDLYYHCEGKKKEENLESYCSWLEQSYCNILKYKSITVSAPFTKTMHKYDAGLFIVNSN